MAHTISEWFLPLFSWAHFSPESSTPRISRLEKLRAERTSVDAHKRNPCPLSPEEEIIIQMRKEYPTLFIA
jgi:hypothetical protein